ncbi:MAG: NAD(P)-dependent oxidoreductase [Bacteriovoracaceae bacterium]|nr:NAD(P)-dependent oxidoreductase [Bacteroidota bacterium]
MKIVITGDSGFIGSYLTRYLDIQGHSVVGIDINPAKKYEIGYQSVIGDILDETALEKLPNDIDCIIHLAAAHKDFGISEEEYYRTNVDGIRSLVKFASIRKIKKFIFYSTVAVYGNNQPSTETTPPGPINHYGGSKLEAEQVLQLWTNEDASREVVIIRPAVVFGPLNVANIFKLIKQVCDGKFYWVGDGQNIKSIAYVENLVEATGFLLGTIVRGCTVYNYSDEPQFQTRELVALISRLSGKKVSALRIPLSAAMFVAGIFDIFGKITGYDFPITSARIKKFNTSTEHRAGKIRAAGFHPSHTIEEGIRKNIEWYVSNGKHVAMDIESSGE